MGTLYVDHKGYELRLRDGVVELRANGALVRAVPAVLIDRIVLRADTSIGSATIAALSDRGIGLLAFGGRTGQRVAHVLGPPHNSARARVAQCQRLDDERFATTWSCTIVRLKLLKQRRLLTVAAAERPELRKPLTDARQAIDRCLDRLPEASNRESVRGLEGSAAASYFRGFSALFAPSLGFECRRRRPPPDPVNACLSLGYTLLYAHGIEAAWAAGLDPMVGLLHVPAHGRASFACDLVEPWRAAIDHWVWQQFRERALRPEHFGRDGAGACVIGKAARSHIYAAVEPLLRRCGRGMRRHAMIAARVLADAAHWPAIDDSKDLEDPA